MSAVLYVCTGNICRSPTAEAVMRHIVAEQGLHDRYFIDSAGTHGYHIGQGPDPRSVAAAAGRGISMQGLVARAVETADFARFDLILAMDKGHLRHLERMKPPVCRAALGLFMDFDPDGPRGLDVPDPYYGGADGFERVLDMIFAANRGVLAHLGGKKS